MNAINKNGWTALDEAVFDGHLEVCVALLERGASLQNKDETSYTVLHWAAMRGHTQLCIALLEYGADPLSVSKDGKTALNMAVENDHHTCAGAIRSWLTANAARQVLQEISLVAPPRA